MRLTIEIEVAEAVLDLEQHAADADVDLTEIQDDDDRIKAAGEIAAFLIEGELELIEGIVKLIAGSTFDDAQIVEVSLSNIEFDQPEEISL